MTSKTQTCRRCTKAFAPFVERSAPSPHCRKCAAMFRGMARRKLRAQAEAEGNPWPEYEPTPAFANDCRPAYLRHTAVHSEQWYLRQQVAWEDHMARLGIKKVATGEMQRTPAPDVVFRAPRRPVLARSEGRPRHG